MGAEELINKLKLNKRFLASKMKMPRTTFQNKLSSKLPAWRFMSSEEQQLYAVLAAIAQQIEDFLKEYKTNKNDRK